MTKLTRSKNLRRVVDSDGTVHDLSKGYIVYQGPSVLDGTTILGIVTMNSTNEKTGNMAQLWILVENEHPVLARGSRRDKAICGDCPVWAICYVVTAFGPAAVWNAFRDGVYSVGFPPKSRKKLRFGAYGDPAALPLWVVRYLETIFDGHTGYTHQWETTNQAFQAFTMASVESHEGRRAAKAAGWRTFRVTQSVTDVLPGEIICPATPEGGSKTLCENCMLCSGSNRNTEGVKDIVAIAHGGKATTDRLIQIGVAA